MGRPVLGRRSHPGSGQRYLQGPMPNRSTSRKSVVGLEIEPSKLAAAEVHGDTAAVEGAATTMLPPAVMRDGEVVDVDALAEALKTFFREKKLPRHVRLRVAYQRILGR